MDTSHPRDRALALGRDTWGEGWTARRIAEAPGRLELLGNHVDYNGGPVLAGAIDRVVAIVTGPGAAPATIELVAGDVSREPHAVDLAMCQEWSRAGTGAASPGDYAAGVIAALEARNLHVEGGQRLAIAGNVPLGFGMSSSAALCVSLVLMLAPGNLPDREIVEIAREAEHRCGSPVGAMDQSASIAGGIILFDGATTSFSRLEPDLGDLIFVVADSGVQHALGDSSYPRRVEESSEALGILQAHVDASLDALAAVPAAVWAEERDRDLPGMTAALRKRVDHVVSEVARVREGVEAVQEGDWERFGALMTASGHSSAELYEISHPKVEELVHQLLAHDGVLGARMMGGGEGGPALALMRAEALAEVRTALKVGFFRHHDSHLDGQRLQVCSFGPGARVALAGET